MLKKKKILPAYISNQNSTREKAITVNDSKQGREGRHYLAVKKLRGIF